jgi:hypothetical protein
VVSNRSGHAGDGEISWNTSALSRPNLGNGEIQPSWGSSMCETLVASNTVVNEIDRLVCQLVDDVAGLQNARDAASAEAMRAKVRVIDALRGTKSALADIAKSQDAWGERVLEEAKKSQAG